MKKKLMGTVKKASMEKSAVVTVNRIVVHPKYKKRTKKTKQYIVHNDMSAKAGDKVQIEEIKPMSRHKRFSVIKIIK